MCARRGALLSAELSQRTALGILTALCPGAPTPEFWCPFLRDHCQPSLQLLPRRAPGGLRSLGDLGRLAFSSRPRDPPTCAWVLGGSAWAQARRRGRAPVRAERAPGRRCQALPPGWLPARPGALAVPSLRLAGLAPHRSGPRELEQRPHRPLFRLHLLRLLLLPPASRAVLTGLDWPRCPAKERGVCVCAEWGRTQGRTSRGGGEKEGGARRRGPAPFLHVAAAAPGLGGGRGRRLPRQRVAGPIAQYSGRGRGRRWGRAPG